MSHSAFGASSLIQEVRSANVIKDKSLKMFFFAIINQNSIQAAKVTKKGLIFGFLFSFFAFLLHLWHSLWLFGYLLILFPRKKNTICRECYFCNR
jgi:hypothetical protein